MNRYDKEITIISDFQEFNNHEIIFFPNSFKLKRIFNSIYSRKKWVKWVDSSSKKDLPPDFFNPHKKLMMDVMRIDDHTYVDKNGKIVNPHNKRESEILKEMIKINPLIKEVAEEGHVFITPYTGLTTDEDHNYRYYVDTFKRTVSKHLNKIDFYKINHPKFKTIFFILDESSPYARVIEGKTPKNVGDGFLGQPHLWWFDKNMMDVIRTSNIDYVIWMAPYKHFDNKEHLELPKAIIIDVKRFNYERTYEYKESELISLEI